MFCLVTPDVIVRVASLSIEGLMLISVFMPTLVYRFVFHDSREHSIHRAVVVVVAHEEDSVLLPVVGDEELGDDGA